VKRAHGYFPFHHVDWHDIRRRGGFYKSELSGIRFSQLSICFWCEKYS